MKAVIFAAGKGERMMPLTMFKPKCMLSVCGKPILEWNLLSLEKAGIKKVVIVTRHLSEKIFLVFGKKFGGLSIEYVKQNRFPGTAMALFAARNLLKKNFLALNGDSVYSSMLLKKMIKRRNSECFIAVQKSFFPKNMGAVLIDDKKVFEIVEKPLIKKRVCVWVNTGLYKFKENIFSAMTSLKPSLRGEYELTDFVNILARKGAVKPVFWHKTVPHFSSPTDLKRVKKIVV